MLVVFIYLELKYGLSISDSKLMGVWT